MEFISINPFTMDNGEQLLLLLDGKPAEFMGDVISLNRPDLLNTELFVFAKSQIGNVIVGNYALLGRDAITGVVPEPSSIVLALLGLLGFVGMAWRKRTR